MQRTPAHALHATQHSTHRFGARVGALMMAALTLVGCTDRKLVPVEQDLPENVDDLVDIEANFCTLPPAENDFPVKLLLVMDTSGSLQFTDQSGLRRPAVRELMSALSQEKGLQVATFGFGSNINVDPPTDSGLLFRDAADWPDPPFIGLADVQTNYFGALSAVKTQILKDLLATSQRDPSEISRTKYIIIFFSDGAPSPKCCIAADEQCFSAGNDPNSPNPNCSPLTPFQSIDGAAYDMPYGCQPEAFELPIEPGQRYCEGEIEPGSLTPGAGGGICNDADSLGRIRDPENNPPAESPPTDDDGNVFELLNGLEVDNNYNRTFQNEDLVSDIMKLGEDFGVGEIRLHTALLFNSNLPDAIKVIVRAQRCRSAGLLQSMAELGNGIFRDFENGEDIDFLSFNFTSLKQPSHLLRAYAQNRNALPPPSGGDVAQAVEVVDFAADSDGDGLSDDEEQELGTDVASADSDKLAVPPSVTTVPEPIQDPAAWGDGYSDLFEADRLNVGFDPRFQSLPVDLCPAFAVDDRKADLEDLDADGLNGCEENVLGSNVERADGDADGIPDLLEVRFGLNPSVAEGNRDSDFDGLPNADEVVRGLDPLLPDEDRRERQGVRYELINTGDTDDGRTCYKSIARGVHLATTAPRFPGGRSGYNDVLYWLAESPVGSLQTDMRVACHRAQYLKPSFKDPANGKIVFNEEDFVDLTDPAVIQRIRDGEDICGGLEVR